MKKTITLKKGIIILFILFSNYSFSQFHYFYKDNFANGISGIKYQDNFYDVNAKGLEKFINETEMPTELKKDLFEQTKKIRKNQTISSIALYGGFAGGAGIMINEALNPSDGGKMKSSNLFMGLGVAVLGGIINLIVKPKIKDYFHFVNTFNNNNLQESKIDFEY